MKTFTRRELVHTAIKEIRVRLELYEETENLKYINSADDIAITMKELKIIEYGKWWLLHKIINNECRRLLKKESPAPNGRQDNHNTNLIVAQMP